MHNSMQSLSRSGSSHGNANGKAPQTPRPQLAKRHNTIGADASGSPIRTGRQPQSMEVGEHARPTRQGEANIEGQSQPVRPVRMAEEMLSTPDASSASRRVTSAPAPVVASASADHDELGSVCSTDDTHTTENMRVLVAEDDPVNSRIIKKRLEKLGHEVWLTVNGEECASAYGDRTGFFDIVLMDMQVSLCLV